MTDYVNKLRLVLACPPGLAKANPTDRDWYAVETATGLESWIHPHRPCSSTGFAIVREDDELLLVPGGEPGADTDACLIALGSAVGRVWCGSSLQAGEVIRIFRRDASGQSHEWRAEHSDHRERVRDVLARLVTGALYRPSQHLARTPGVTHLRIPAESDRAPSFDLWLNPFELDLEWGPRARAGPRCEESLLCDLLRAPILAVLPDWEGEDDSAFLRRTLVHGLTASRTTVRSPLTRLALAASSDPKGILAFLLVDLLEGTFVIDPERSGVRCGIRPTSEQGYPMFP